MFTKELKNLSLDQAKRELRKAFNANEMSKIKEVKKAYKKSFISLFKSTFDKVLIENYATEMEHAIVFGESASSRSLTSAQMGYTLMQVFSFVYWMHEKVDRMVPQNFVCDRLGLKINEISKMFGFVEPSTYEKDDKDRYIIDKKRVVINPMDQDFIESLDKLVANGEEKIEDVEQWKKDLAEKQNYNIKFDISWMMVADFDDEDEEEDDEEEEETVEEAYLKANYSTSSNPWAKVHNNQIDWYKAHPDGELSDEEEEEENLRLRKKSIFDKKKKKDDKKDEKDSKKSDEKDSKKSDKKDDKKKKDNYKFVDKEDLEEEKKKEAEKAAKKEEKPVEEKKEEAKAPAVETPQQTVAPKVEITPENVTQQPIEDQLSFIESLIED